jgi:hypothetical protein
MDPVIDGFDWDAANREKCSKHGVTIAEIEALLWRASRGARRAALGRGSQADRDWAECIWAADVRGVHGPDHSGATPAPPH